MGVGSRSEESEGRAVAAIAVGVRGKCFLIGRRSAEEGEARFQIAVVPFIEVVVRGARGGYALPMAKVLAATTAGSTSDS